MKSEEQFLALVCAIFGIVFLGVSALIFAHNYKTNERIAKMVDAGASAMEASCALSQQQERVCTLWIAAHKEADQQGKAL